MKKLKFVRYGGLSPVKQDQYTTNKDKTFHNPPRKKGNYAFPYSYIERFLIGSTDQPGHISNKAKWLKDKNGNKIVRDDFYIGYDNKKDKSIINPKYIKLLKKLKIKQSNIGSSNTKKDDSISYITVLKKPKIFEYDGEIWHHLGDHLKPHQIIESSGSWIKSDIIDYMIAFNKEMKLCRNEMLKMTKDWKIELKDQLNINPLKNFFSKDHLEVFIEKIK